LFRARDEMIELFQALEFADSHCPPHIPKPFHRRLRIGDDYGVWCQARNVGFHVAGTRFAAKCPDCQFLKTVYCETGGAWRSRNQGFFLGSCLGFVIQIGPHAIWAEFRRASPVRIQRVQVRLTPQADSTDNDERGDSKVGAAPKPARDAP
jgi:hypothetical protein